MAVTDCLRQLFTLINIIALKHHVLTSTQHRIKIGKYTDKYYTKCTEPLNFCYLHQILMFNVYVVLPVDKLYKCMHVLRQIQLKPNLMLIFQIDL